MDRNSNAGQRLSDVGSKGILESDDCSSVGLTRPNYSPELSPRGAYWDFDPSVTKADWARPSPHPREFVFNYPPTDAVAEDSCLDSGVALSCPSADDDRERSFPTSTNPDFDIRSSSEEGRVVRSDEEFPGLDICNLRISDEVGTTSERKEAEAGDGVRSDDVVDCRMNWDLIFEQDEDGDTQLHIAVMMDTQMDFALSVINLCPNDELLDLQNDLHQTALHLAIHRRQLQIMQALVSRDTSLTVCDRDGNTPLHLACQMGYTEAVNALTHRFRSLTEKALLLDIIHRKNYEGLTCCHLSAMSQVPDNLFHLTQDCSADINIQEGKRGMTVLHMATISNKEILVAFLLAQPNINLNQLTYDGWTALDLANGRRLAPVQELLISAGALQRENFTTSSDSETSELEEDMEADDLVSRFESLKV